MKTKLLLSAMMLSMSLSLFAQSGTCGDNLTWTLSSGTLTISGTGPMTDFNFFPHTPLRPNTPWYYYLSSIKTVIIEDGVTSIGYLAFEDCTGLTSITIPNSVTSIGYRAFYYCTGLTSVTIPSSVTSIGYDAFDGCKITKIYFSGTMEEWCTKAFSPNSISSSYTLYINGKAVTNAVIPNSVTSIGNYAFYDCSSLTALTIGNSVISIGTYAFSSCSGLTSIIIPNSVTSIGGCAFDSCSGLASVTIGESVTSIGDYAFKGCSKLATVIWNAKKCNDFYSNTPFFYRGSFDLREQITSFTFGDNVEYIPAYLCSGMSNLTSITIPNSVTSIGSDTFYGCSSLASVTIGESVTSIGKLAFRGCSKLTTVIWNAKECNDFSYYTPFCYYDSRISTYNFDISKQITSFTFGDNVEYIPASLCSGMSNLTSITIPNSVTSIGGSAFSGCTGLTSITIPNSVTSIGESAFWGCSELTAVHISDIAAWCKIAFGNYAANPISSYARNLYLNGTLVTDLVIPDGVTTIGDRAFYNCESLTSVIIPNSVTSIGYEAFYYCRSLTSATIGNSVTSIGERAFIGCSRLTSITCEAVNPPTLGDDVFYDMNKSIPLYVPADAVKRYKSAEGWKDFTNILPIGSQTGDVTTPTITVTTTSADIAWPQISGAASYELVIKDKKGNVVCTLVFDAEGHLTSLNFGVPDRDNIRKQPQAGTFSFTVTGLKENTEYTYTLTAKDSKGKAIDTKTGTFKTIGGTPVDETERDAAPAPRKLLKNGILYILTPDGTAYDLQGQRID